jgi:hypothetical protein
MRPVSIRDLTVRRSSGSISLGVASGEVLSALGEPTDRSRTQPPILKYGPLELTFIKDRLVLIAYYAGQTPDPRIEEDLPGTRAEVERMFRHEGVAFSENATLSFDDQTALSLDDDPLSVVVFDQAELATVQFAEAEKR